MFEYSWLNVNSKTHCIPFDAKKENCIKESKITANLAERGFTSINLQILLQFKAEMLKQKSYYHVITVILLCIKHLKLDPSCEMKSEPCLCENNKLLDHRSILKQTGLSGHSVGRE